MLEFLRAIRSLLDRRIRRALIYASIAATGLALLEAFALTLIIPLVQLLTSSGRPRSGLARLIGDQMPGASDLRIAAVLGSATFIAFVVKGVLSLVYLRWNVGTLQRAEAETSSRLLRAYLRAPYPFHLRRGAADLQKTVHDAVHRIYADALLGIVGAIADLIVMVAVAVVLVTFEPIAAISAAGYFALVAVGYQRLIHRRAAQAGRALTDEMGHSYQIVQQAVTAIKAVQVGHHEDHFAKQLRASKDVSAGNLRTLMLLYQAPRYYLEIALIVGLGLMGGILFYLRPAEAATAALGLFLAAGLRILPSLNRVLVALGGMRAALDATRQVAADLTALDAPRAVEAVSGTSQSLFVESPFRELTFDRVCFSYSGGGSPVLYGLSLTVRRGQSVAFVGTSGAGKTTLLDVVLGLLEPTSGVVLVDGRPLGQVRRDWQRSIGYVPQDTAILDATMRENIAFGLERAEIDEAAVLLAVERAELTDLVASLPEGLDTRLQERGVRLSGGQRQRVGIARALYSQPSILVLDEATSSLDVETESRITQTVEGLAGELTLLIVTHRLSTVRRCDQINVLERGCKVAVGTFDELREGNELFARLLLISLGPQQPTADSERAGQASPRPVAERCEVELGKGQLPPEPHHGDNSDVIEDLERTRVLSDRQKEL